MPPFDDIYLFVSTHKKRVLKNSSNKIALSSCFVNILLFSLDYFYKIRALDRDKQVFESLTNAERAARTIYLNKTCYNGRKSRCDSMPITKETG